MPYNPLNDAGASPIADAILFILTLLFVTGLALLVMWLAWVGYKAVMGKGDPDDTPGDLRWQLITLGVMLSLAVGCWFIFGLSKKLDFDEPRYLLLTLLVIPIFGLGAWSLSQLEPPRRWSSVYLRMLVLLVLIAMLAGFRTVQRRDDLSVVAIVDVSESVKRFALAPEGAVGPDGKPMTVDQWVQSYILEAADGQRTGDTFSYHEFDGRPTVRSRPQEGAPSFPDGLVDQPYEGTNVERAIKAGIAARSSPDAAHRLVLAWDGNDTTGNVIEAAREAAAEGITIDVLPILYHVENEVMVEGVYVPTEAREGQTLPLRVVLRATAPVDGQVQLTQDDAVIDLNGPDIAGTGRPIEARDWRRVDADAPTTDSEGRLLGDYVLNTIISRPVTEAGITRYKAIFVPNDQSGAVNAVRANDTAESFTLVAGPGKVLIVDGVGGDPGLILPRALSSHGIDLDIVTPISMPARAEALQRYDAVIFHNVPADNISPATQEVLAQYVHDFGGGFMMVGGPNAFGAGGWTNSVIDEFILPVNCEIQSQRQLPSGALVLVVDRSGSMFGGNGHIANEAAVLALSTLYPQDMVGVVAFDTRAHWVQKLELNSDPAGTAQRIRSLQAGGGTDVRAGLEAAYAALHNVPMGEAAIKHVILVTDGATGGANWIELMGRYRQAGITLTAIGTGQGNNSQLLSNLASMGRGTYYDVTDPNNLPQVFIKEARAIRKNLIFEQTFTPLVRAVGSPIMSGINAVPDLHGFVLTGPKQDPRIFMPITGPEGEPIFAHHQVGLGRAAAYTADATNRWGQDWLSWGGYADFWARSLRQISRPPLSVEADLAATIRGDELVLRLDAAGDVDFNAPAGNAGASAFGNNLKVRGVVTGPNGQIMNVELEQVGPGIYETRLPVHESGSYIADLNLARPDGEARRVISGASKLEGGELRNFQSNMAAITQVAELTGGRVLDPAHPDAAGLYARNIPFESVSSRPLLWKLAPFLLLFLILDVACRRIAWDANEIGDWARGRANAVFGIMSTRKVEAGATLSALKARQAATKQSQAGDERSESSDAPPHADADRSEASGLAALRQSRATAQQGGQPAAAATAKKKPPKPAASRTRKFVATEEQLATAKDDFAAAVGGAKEGIEAKPIVSARARKSEKDLGPTTSRLLDAKRRAQERMNEKEGD